jgi:Asp/Glu/hydantoin racemase
MKRLALIHTVDWYQSVITKPFFNALLDKYPNFEIMNILDSTLLSDSLKAGYATDEILHRIVGYALLAQTAGADMVMCSCTTVNKAMQLARESGKFHIPALNIDEPMIEKAIEAGSKFGIVATLETSPQGTCYLLEREAKKRSKEIEMEIAVCPAAFDALMDDDMVTHDKLVCAEIERLAKRVDVVLLGQISLSQVKCNCEKPVFQTGVIAVETVEKMLGL